MSKKPVIITEDFAKRLDTGLGRLSPASTSGQQGKQILSIKHFWAKITGYATIGGATNRWAYSWEENYRTETGWATLTNGRSSTLSAKAYNSIEANNDGSGVQGNSIDIDALAAGFSLVPVQGNPVVLMTEELQSDMECYYSFSYENAVDGECG